MAKKTSFSELTDINQFIELLKVAETHLKGMIEMSAKVMNQKGDTGKDIIEKTKAIENAKIAEKGLSDTQKERLALEVKANEIRKQTKKELEDEARALSTKQQAEKGITENQKKIIENQKKIAEQRKEAKRQITEETSAYAKLSNILAANQKKWLDLAAAGRENTKEGRQLLKVTQQQDAAIKKLDATIGRSQRNVGNYASAFKGLGSIMGAFGVGSGIYLLAGALTDAFKTIKEFEQSMANVKSVTGATKEEFIQLRELAVKLGGSTKFTAIEIAGLETELGKLGFTTKEIIGATSGITLAAAATGESLEVTAEIVGGVVRAYGLAATESTRVSDVMAASFNATALDLSNFKESIKYVAPVAKAANVSLEQTVAMLGQLANAGIKGSMAGTSLRRILTDMARTGKPAGEALKELSKNGITLNDAFDEVGRTAQTSLLILGNNIDKIDTLATSFENAAGSAQKMADIQMDTLQGDITLLKANWDSFILSLNSSDGVISNTFRFLIQYIDRAVSGIKILNDRTKAGYQLEKDKIEAERVGTMLGRETKQSISKLPIEQQKEKLKEYFKIYGDIIRENNSIIKTNVSENEKINNFIEKRNKLIEENKSISKANPYGLYGDVARDYERNKTMIRLLNDEIGKLQPEKDKRTKESQKAIIESTKYNALLRQLQTQAINDNSNAIDKNNSSIDKNSKSTKKNTKAIKDDRDALDSHVKAQEEWMSKRMRLFTESYEHTLKMNELEFELSEKQLIEMGASQEYIDKRRQQFEIDQRQKRIDYLNQYYNELTDEEKKEEGQSIDRQIQILNKEIDILKVGNAAKIQEQKEYYNELLEITLAYLQKQNEAKLKANDQEISESEKKQDYLRQLAIKGTQGSAEALAFEEKKQAELQQKKLKLEERKRVYELVNSGIAMYTAKIQEGNTKDASTSTVADIGKMIAGIKAISKSYYVGTDYVEGADKTKTGNEGANGEHTAKIHEGEMILEKNRVDTLHKIGIFTRKDLMRAVTQDKTVIVNDNSHLVREIQDLKSVIESKPTYLGMDFDKQNQAVIHIIEQKNKIVRNHKKLKI